MRVVRHHQLTEEIMSKILSREDYKILGEMEREDPRITSLLNRNGCPNWTVCPECHVDDFVHVEGCTLGTEINEGV